MQARESRNHTFNRKRKMRERINLISKKKGEKESTKILKNEILLTYR